MVHMTLQSKYKHFNFYISLSPSLSPANKMSPPASPSAEGKEEWTILDNNNDPVSPPPVPTSPTSHQATSPPAPTNSGTKLGGKISNTFNFRMFKPGKRSQNDSGSVPSRDQGSRKVIHQSGTQTCYKCKVVRMVGNGSMAQNQICSLFLDFGDVCIFYVFSVCIHRLL